MYIILIYYRLHSNLSTTESLRLVEEDLALEDSVGLGRHSGPWKVLITLYSWGDHSALGLCDNFVK